MKKWYPSETLIMGGMAVFRSGLTAGAGIWVFKRMIDLANWAAFDWLGSHLEILGRWQVAILPVIGGLAVGLIAKYLIGHEQHHGVAGVM